MRRVAPLLLFLLAACPSRQTEPTRTKASTSGAINKRTGEPAKLNSTSEPLKAVVRSTDRAWHCDRKRAAQDFETWELPGAPPIQPPRNLEELTAMRDACPAVAKSGSKALCVEAHVAGEDLYLSLAEVKLPGGMGERRMPLYDGSATELTAACLRRASFEALATSVTSEDYVRVDPTVPADGELPVRIDDGTFAVGVGTETLTATVPPLPREFLRGLPVDPSTCAQWRVRAAQVFPQQKAAVLGLEAELTWTTDGEGPCRVRDPKALAELEARRKPGLPRTWVGLRQGG